MNLRFLALSGRVQYIEDPERAEAVRTLLESARDCLDRPVPQGLANRIKNWWSGDRVEQAWAYLEEAEVQIVEGSNELGQRLAFSIAGERADAALGLDDYRRVKAIGRLRAGSPTDCTAPAVCVPSMPEIVEILEACYVAINQYHRSARSLRNRLVVMAGMALVMDAVLVTIQWRLPSQALINPPTDADDLEPWMLLLIVMVLGSVGALLTTIRPISVLPAAMSPFNFPLHQAYLKIVTGSLTAVVGLLVFTGFSAGGATVIELSTFRALMFGAVLFGAGQQAVTRMLDARATSLINGSPLTGEGA